MKYPVRTLAATAIIALITAAAPAHAGKHEYGADGDMMAVKGDMLDNGFRDAARTMGRLPSGDVFAPQRLYDKPEHYGFKPYVSNWDPQNDHPQQWDGQDWDPSMWNKDWTPEVTLNKFFKARIFERQFMRKGKPPVPVLELGPTFYKISDLDQRRALKLLADFTGVFNEGFPVVELRDWHTEQIVGTYTPKGMFMN